MGEAVQDGVDARQGGLSEGLAVVHLKMKQDARDRQDTCNLRTHAHAHTRNTIGQSSVQIFWLDKITSTFRSTEELYRGQKENKLKAYLCHLGRLVN